MNNKKPKISWNHILCHSWLRQSYDWLFNNYLFQSFVSPQIIL